MPPNLRIRVLQQILLSWSLGMGGTSGGVGFAAFGNWRYALPMKQIDLREGARRQHRAISLFAVVQCWLHTLDGVAFQRPDLQRLLGLERFKLARVEWLEEDLKEFFPYIRTYWLSKRNNSLGSLIVARVPIAEALPLGTMTTEARLKGIPAGGPRLALFKLWQVPNSKATQQVFEGLVPFFSDAANYDERFLTSYLALLGQGMISPQSLPPLKAAKDED